MLAVAEMVISKVAKKAVRKGKNSVDDLVKGTVEMKDL